MTTAHPSAQLDETVHQRNRLGILAILAEADKVEFGFLQSTLAMTPGNVSRHLSVLEGAGLVLIEKVIAGKRTKTWVSITTAGRKALAVELRALKAIVELIEANSAMPWSQDGWPSADRRSATIGPFQEPPAVASVPSGFGDAMGSIKPERQFSD